ncbi:hypothetical protein ACOMHN_066040 [Nucella lapillus]
MVHHRFNITHDRGRLPGVLGRGGQDSRSHLAEVFTASPSMSQTVVTTPALDTTLRDAWGSEEDTGRLHLNSWASVSSRQ